MATKKESKVLERAKEDEDVFVLRAQDYTSAKTIVLWIAENIEEAPPEKLREALEVALKMQRYPNRRFPT